ncbi:MexW/MexI family multidrug efflux RND transporter permease subunit [Dongia sp.]|uniref:MexW/MexI family multidrug efflux RND transporter permease subunit n=1 Tax=Dongia sp. TaxID=1977262 RepID=UPI0037511AB6
MRFTDIFIRRPVLATVVSLLILLIGARAFFDLTVRQYPELQNTVITVTTSFPGADPNLMQGFITQPIEQAVSSAEGIDYMTSSSTQGLSTVSVYIRLNYDPNKAMTDVMAKVQQVKYLIPQEANDPVITKQTGDAFAIMYIGFASTELDAAAITDHLTRVVQPLLATVDGVAQAEILGGQTFAMRLWLDPERMTALGVTASDVADAIRANNYQSAPGQTKGYFTVSNITANTDLKSLDEFRNMVVRADGGTLIRLEDVGTVDLSAQSYDSNVLMNGQEAVFIGVQPTPTGNPLNIVADIRAMAPDLERSLPPTVNMDIAYDSTKFIKSSIAEVEHTLALAVGIVIVVIFLFLGTFRSVVIPVVTIPLSLVGAFVIMLAFGFSINLLTLLAMVLAIGLVVDDAIVVVENIHRHIEEGLTPVQAALLGAREIAGPVIAMTITLAAVYAPIGFLSGLTGTLFREFAFTLAGTVVISGIVALTLSPMMCSVLLKRGMNEGWFPHLVDRVFGATERFYGRRLHDSLNHRAAVTLFGATILGLLAFFYLHARAELAPEEDQGVIFAIGKGPQYSNLDYTKIFSDQVDQVYTSFPETVGRFMLNGYSGLNSSISGMVLKEWEDRSRSVSDLQPQVQGKLNGVTGMQVFAFNLPALPGGTGGMPVSMVISAPEDFTKIYENMEVLKQKAAASGLFMVTDSDLSFNSPMVRVNIDRAKASDMGITMQAIGDTMALMIGGNYVNRFNLNGRSYEVIPQVPRGERLTPERLTQYYVRTTSGSLVPLSTVVSIGSGIDPNALTHYNQLNSATFQAVPGIGITMSQVVDFLNKTAEEVLPASYHRDFLSESRQYVREGNQLAITFVFALIIIYLVLAAQFESLRDPIVILVSVPLSICGAMVPMFLGMQSLNIYTQVGLVTLIGLISKHGILMTEFANQLQRKEGMSKRDAIQQAAVVRLRPILMTTAAMVVGLIPLLMATGAGAASRFAIGLTIVLGMGIGTLFTLFVLPTFYTLLATDHRESKREGRKSEIEAVS